jgi:hypothetical protein
MRLHSFGAWSTPHYMTKLIPHAFSSLSSHSHISSPLMSQHLNTYMSPPHFVFVYGTKNKKPQKNNI